MARMSRRSASRQIPPPPRDESRGESTQTAPNVPEHFVARHHTRLTLFDLGQAGFGLQAPRLFEIPLVSRLERLDQAQGKLRPLRRRKLSGLLLEFSKDVGHS